MGEEELQERIKNDIVPGKVNIDEYVIPDQEIVEDAPSEQQNNTPLHIKKFPWDERFKDIKFTVGNVSIRENDDDTASLYFNYNVIASPNITLQEDTEEHYVLDTFVGRVVECLLYNMSQDEEFMNRMAEMNTIEMPDTEDA